MKKKGLSLLLAGIMIFQSGLTVQAADMEFVFQDEIGTENVDIQTENTPNAEDINIEEENRDMEFSDSSEIEIVDVESDEEGSEDDIQIEYADEEANEASEIFSESEIAAFEESNDFKPEERTTKDGIWTYMTLRDGSIMLLMYHGTETKVVIPGELEGYTVTSISNPLFCGEFKISDQGIGYFEPNTTVTSVTFPASVTDIDEEFFDNMYALEEVIVDSENTTYASKNGAFFSKDMKVLRRYPRNKKDKDYVLPEETTEVLTNVFCRNPYITSLDFNHVTKFRSAVVQECEALQKVDFGDYCTEITDAVVHDCQSLKEIELPKTLTDLQNIVSLCLSLDTVKMDVGGKYCCEDNIIFTSDKKKLVYYAPARKGTEYTIPDYVTELEYGAFIYVENLKTLTIPSGISRIRRYTFKAMSGGGGRLTKIKIYNPECVIYDAEDTLPSLCEIWGYAFSTAYDYAEDYGRTFVDIESENSQSNPVTWEKLLNQLPTDIQNYGEPVYQTSNVIHESDTSNENYVKLKAFTKELIADCDTDYKKVKTISDWVHNHITYRYFGIAGNSVESVYSLFNQESPSGNCMAYTRLTAYMLYLAGIGSVEAVSETHEWCMTLLDGKWYVVDSTNGILTSDYSLAEVHFPKYLSFSKNGNVYAVKNNSGIYLCAGDYANAGDVFQIPDYVERFLPTAFENLGDRKVIARSEVAKQLKRYLPCLTTNNDNTVTARKFHSFSGWEYVDNVSSRQERKCSICGSTEQQIAPLQTDLLWMESSSYTAIVGTTIALKVSSLSNSKFYYRSSNPEVVSVTGDGKMSLKKGGTATVYVYTKDSGRYKAAEKQVQVRAVDLAKPKITNFKITGFEPGYFGNTLYFTVSWSGVKNADSYKLCCKKNGESGYRYQELKKTAKNSYTSRYSVTLGKNEKASVWISAYNKLYKLNNDSAVKKFDLVSYLEEIRKPAKTRITSLKNLSGRKMQVKWKKVSSATGYQIQYATDKNFTRGKKTVTISKKNATSTKIGKLTKKKTYYVRIRTRRKVAGKYYYSNWSATAKVKIKK